MAKSYAGAAIVLVLCAGAALSGLAAEPVSQPLRQTELLALVAGGVLPENLVREIGTYGLAFHPDDPYRSQLKNAGADDSILKALDSAKTVAVRPADVYKRQCCARA